MSKSDETASSQSGWLPRLNLIFTMVLTALGLWLNYTAQLQKQAFESQKLAIEQLQSQLAERKDSREERGSREGLRLQLFDKVASALEKKEQQDRQFEAARALVLSLLSTNDPAEALLRVGLMEALTLNAPPEKQQELKKVVEDETTYLNDQRELAAEVQQQPGHGAANGSTLAACRVDVFYCGGPAKPANLSEAQRMYQTLQDRVSGIQVRMRELAPSINASPGFSVTRNEVRYEASTEATVAAELAKILSVTESPLPMRTVNTFTPWYLSVFAC